MENVNYKPTAADIRLQRRLDRLSIKTRQGRDPQEKRRLKGVYRDQMADMSPEYRELMSKSE